MDKINSITEKYATLPYMKHEQALLMRNIIQQNKFKNLCELGHFHGKSSIYLGAILEEQGFGKLTTFDVTWSETLTPRIHSLINEFSLEEYVTPVVTTEGYAWDLAELIKSSNQKFDFCYIDGVHTFESTAIAFVLMDILLDKGGIIVFDDLHWSVNYSLATLGNTILDIPLYRNSTDKQKDTAQVKMVCDLILPNYNYTLVETIDKFGWAIFRKNGN